MIPVVVEEGVTSLSTLTQLFTLTNTLAITPSPRLLPTQQVKTSSGFVDFDADFESGVKTLSERKVYYL